MTHTTDTKVAANISNYGTGNSFVVEDSASDTTPFIIDNAGQVGIGTASPTSLLHLSASNNNAMLNISNGTNSIFFINGTLERVGIGTTVPANKLNIEGSGNALNVSSGASCSYIAAGSTSFTACSSRDIKENIEPFTVSNILGKIASVPVNRFDFINGSKGNVGLIAEDFYSVLGKGSNSTVSGQDVDMALWLAVQELAKENEELKARIAALESRI